MYTKHKPIRLAAALLLLGGCAQAPSMSEPVADDAPQADPAPSLPSPSTGGAPGTDDVLDEFPTQSDDVPCPAAAAGDSDAEVAQRINADVAALGDDASDQLMYISLAHLAEGRSECDMRELRFGVGKLINMMSWAPDIVAPTFIDDADYIARVDVRKLKWTPESLPYLLAASTHRDYGVIPGATANSFRADWLSQHLTKPMVYGSIMQNPATERAIEEKFGVDPFVVGKFAGVSDSIVTLHPRIIERHEAKYGACYVTHDFLHRPQALQAMETGELPQPDARFLIQQYIAREYICSLPNGMHSYHLTGFVSQRRWDGNTCVAQNPIREDKLVLNGQCFSCHTNGLNDFKDEIRPRQANPSEFVLEHYPEHADMQALFDEDQAQFEAAIAEIPYYEKGMFGPLNVLMAIYRDRANDDMFTPYSGTFGAILPNGVTAGPFWEEVINPLATYVVDVGILAPAEALFENLPETLVPALEDKYREVGLDSQVNCN